MIVQDSNPGRGKEVFLLPNRPDRLWVPPSLLFNEYRLSCSVVQQPGPEVEHSSPFMTEVKNEWSSTFTSPTCLHDVDKYNVTFTVSKIGSGVSSGKSRTVARNDKFRCN